MAKSIQLNRTGRKTQGLSGVPDAQRFKKPMKSVGSEVRTKVGGTIAAQSRSKSGIK